LSKEKCVTKTPAKSHKTQSRPAAKKAPAKSAGKKPAGKAVHAKKAAAKPAGKKAPAKTTAKKPSQVGRSVSAKAGKARAPAPKTPGLSKGTPARKTPARAAPPAGALRKRPAAVAKGAARGGAAAVERVAAQPPLAEAKGRATGRAATHAQAVARADKTAAARAGAAAKAAVMASPAAHQAEAPAANASRFAARFSPARPAPRIMDYAEVEVTRPAIKADPRLANAWKNKAGRDLTDDELLAMPDSEYMGEKQLEFFRCRLQKLKDDLLSNADETTEHLREDTSIVPDPADRATIEEEHALELRTRDRERKLLKKITQSLARIDSGEYGFCDETGEPIGLARLLARPTATLSLEAQQRRELKQKLFGD
jgi:DnaK suppressor protein